MFRSALPAVRRAGPSLRPTVRFLATVLPESTAATVSEASSSSSSDLALRSSADGPALRPQTNVQVDPNHGLWAFFRKDRQGKVLTLEPSHKTEDFSGRAWHASELRRKSFKDLHILWYACLRERNLLATQMAEFRRLDISVDLSNSKDKDRRVRKTMSGIKHILNERRLAYNQAKELWEKENIQAIPPLQEAEAATATVP
ncbi:54S ribosomal protein L4 mitochondrial [Tulasnella sp. JGI-2019a]|nr:54S ribosomal protein L4 mitochondrial [Tulasnella sp. JGI-2019a]KAG9011763.1 54S ribosomal protein L4 mitochondrial [Tulasnella sp. JGI-2019a]KAG9036989.1 54S ribosomal protein L4 mitochondrial [Tulasnella sp. JGI-2019a]